MNEQIKKIKEEIERLKAIHESNLDKAMERGRIGHAHGYIDCCEELLSFIDSLEQEQIEEISPKLPLISQEPKIKGWVARDKNGTIRVGEYKPERGSYEAADGRWVGYGENMKLPLASFPHLSWVDEPIEVELTIHRV